MQEKKKDDYVKEVMENLSRKIKESRTEYREESKDTGDKWSSTIRLSLNMKNRLKQMTRRGESYEDVIERLIRNEEKKERQLKRLKELVKQNEDLIKYSTEIKKRERKIFTTNSGVKIRFSYNKPDTLDEDSYDIRFEGFYYKGKEITEEEAYKILAMDYVFRLLQKGHLSKKEANNIISQERNLKGTINQIRIRYLVYFKIFFDLISDGQKANERNFFDINFWKLIAERYDLSDESFRRDIKDQLTRYESEKGSER
ncbi:MAG: DUF7557 family protein [Nanobdellota archaeon]